MIPFVKMQAAGNDYVVLDGFERRYEQLPALARRMADRHFGIGSDGLILIEPSACAAVRMRMWNSDGTESGMCGNGLRLAARHAWDAGRVAQRAFTIEVGLPQQRRCVRAWVHGDDPIETVSVELGRPRFERSAIPMVGDPCSAALDLELPLPDGRLAQACAVGMGNPHLVLFVQALPPDDEVRVHGAVLERHPWFPERVNVSWARCVPGGGDDGATIEVRVWERGAGPTLACGSGACAVAAAALRTGRVRGRRLRVLAPGGELLLEWPDEDGPIRLRGPAVEVFRGQWPA